MQTVSNDLTWLLGAYFHNWIPLVCVVAYPKSGTTWVAQLLADYLQLPFPRNSILPVGCPAVVHGHQCVWKKYRQAVYVVRDGRDAEVSKYFYNMRNISEGDHPPMTRRERRIFPDMVNKSDVKHNLPLFIESQQTHPVGARVNWVKHVSSYFEVNNPNVVLVRYEDLLADGETALAEVLSKLTGEEPQMDRIRATIERFSFARQKTILEKKRPGKSQFLRKGQSGDWRNYFTRQTAELADRYYGDMLIKCGYEKDHSWVEQFKD